MLLKIFAYSLLAAAVLLLALGARWQGMGLWLKRLVDTALIVLAACLVLQLVLVLAKT